MTGADNSVLDLFSAAAGGWSLGMHRAGFHTVAACEFVDWRRALYSQNNPKARMYDDVRTLTGERLLLDLGFLPRVVVGSPPCQDISPANTKGKGVEGERSGLYFEAVRIIGEVRPRWFALENSANLRTKGADAVLAALEAIGYTCWAFVVRAEDIGANHERARSWLIGCDLGQVTDANHEPLRWSEQSGFEGEGRYLPCAFAASGNIGGQNGAWSLSRGHGGVGQAADADGLGWQGGREGRGSGLDIRVSDDPCHTSEVGCGSRLPRGSTGAIAGPEQPPRGDALDASGFGHEGGRPRGRWANGDSSSSVATRDDANAVGERSEGLSGHPWRERQGEIAECSDLPTGREMELCATDSGYADSSRADWSLDDLARHLRMDDGLSAWLAGSRVAVGGPRGTSAASLIVEAFGDAVVPQIPEAIGRAILRTEAALAAVYGEAA